MKLSHLRRDLSSLVDGNSFLEESNTIVFGAGN